MTAIKSLIITFEKVFWKKYFRFFSILRIN